MTRDIICSVLCLDLKPHCVILFQKCNYSFIHKPNKTCNSSNLSSFILSADDSLKIAIWTCMYNDSPWLHICNPCDTVALVLEKNIDFSLKNTESKLLQYTNCTLKSLLKISVDQVASMMIWCATQCSHSAFTEKKQEQTKIEIKLTIQKTIGWWN